MKIWLFEKSHVTRDTLIKKIYTSILLDIIEEYPHLTNNVAKEDYDIVAIDGDNTEGEFKSCIQIKTKTNANILLIVLLSFAKNSVIKKFKSFGADECYDKVSDYEMFLQRFDAAPNSSKLENNALGVSF